MLSTLRVQAATAELEEHTQRLTSAITALGAAPTSPPAALLCACADHVGQRPDRRRAADQGTAEGDLAVCDRLQRMDQMRGRHDSAQFWLALGGPVIALGFGLITLSSIGLSPGDKPSEPWFAVGIVIAVLGAVMLGWALVLFVRHKYAEHRAQPDLAMEFDPFDPECVQDRRDHPQRDFQLRLRATNTGNVALTEVRCRLKGGHDTYARIRHDNTPPYDRSHNDITLQPCAKDYFDIAFCHFDQPQMVLQHADKYLLDEQIINQTPKTTNTPVEVTVEARREDTNEPIPPFTRRYMVAPDGDAITLTDMESM